MAKAKRNNNDICLYCFGTLSKDRVCLSCGKTDESDGNLPHQLSKRTLLNKHYLISSAIGEGGFGITYRAWDTISGRQVAIKEYYPSGYVSRDQRSNRIVINAKQHHAPTNRGLKRFIDEAQNLSRITDHSGIVEVLDFFSANGTAYIVMEFLDGISLKKYVKRKGKLKASDALTILKPVIYSLRGLHEAGLIHRDISPDNILITRTGEVKLIDFGAAKQNSPTTPDASIVLKQGFAPEEQYRLNGEQGPWTDVYAIGVTLYYCMTGQVPPESIQRMYDDAIVLPSQAGVKIKKKIEKALMKALAVFAKDRYRSIDALVEDLYSETEEVEDEKPELRKAKIKVEPDGQLRIDTDPPAKKTTAKSKTESNVPRYSAISTKRDTSVKRKKTAEDIKKKMDEKRSRSSTTSKTKSEKKEEKVESKTSKPTPRYKTVERKYGKGFADELSRKIKKK